VDQYLPASVAIAPITGTIPGIMSPVATIIAAIFGVPAAPGPLSESTLVGAVGRFNSDAPSTNHPKKNKTLLTKSVGARKVN